MEFVEDEIKIYGKICKGGDAQIRIPFDYTNYLGIQIHDEELERLGIINRESEIPIVWQISNFKKEHSTLEVVEVLNSINPSKVYLPKKGRMKETIFSGKLAQIKVNEYPCGWQELWLSINYRKPAEPQIKEYIEKCTNKFYREYYKEKIEEIKKNILKNPSLRHEFYKTENGIEIDLSKLRPGYVPEGDYQRGHKNTVFGCHDVLLEYNGGLLLVVRDNFPAKDTLWPIGGRLQKGVQTESSLIDKIKEECNLDIEGEIIYLGAERTAFQTDPFNHGHGTDTLNERYFAKSKGKLKLNNLHKDPIIVKPEAYTPEFRKNLEEYVKNFMDLGMLFMDEMNPVLLYSYLNESLKK